MFTGLIEQIGRVERVEHTGGGARLRIGGVGWTTPLTIGESIAVQGACLTVAECEARCFGADVLEATLAVTTLGRLRSGDAVNIERAIPVGGRLGGHIVTGHIDGVGTVAAVTPVNRDWQLAIACDARLQRAIVYKGSIAVDGVSLTVSEETEAGFAVNIIPHTWSRTTLRALNPGAAVNLETDILARYVAKLIAPSAPPAMCLTPETLTAAGF